MREDQLEEWLETDGVEGSLVFDYRSDGMIASYGLDHPLFRYDRVAEFCQNCLDGSRTASPLLGWGAPSRYAGLVLHRRGIRAGENFPTCCGMK